MESIDVLDWIKPQYVNEAQVGSKAFPKKVLTIVSLNVDGIRMG